MRLTQLFEGFHSTGGAAGQIEIRGDAEITGLSMDSRKGFEAGELFFCQRGARFDGHDYAKTAAEAGAAALVVDRWLDDIDIPQVKVSDVREALSVAAAKFYGEPAKGMRMIGVTGTNGKTTTAFLIKAIMDKAGIPCGLIGTVSTVIGDREMQGGLTTPEAIDFQRILRQMRDAGINTLVMEVSANAVTLKRLYGVEFELGVFTNFSQDHLDFYGTMDNYFAAKAQFFSSGAVKKAVINADDERAEQIAPNLAKTCFGVAHQSDVYAKNINMQVRGIAYSLVYRGRSYDIALNLPGLFNVYNSMAAAVAAIEMGVSMEDIVAGLEGVRSVAGRSELLETGTPFGVILDFAHTPESLENILQSVRELTRGKLIVLFGCGGDRDREKRGIMGQIAGELADFTIITSDNPRSEEPMDIIAAIEEGIKTTDGAYLVEENRRAAILAGLTMADAGDTLIIAGKGHETYQEIKGKKLPFNERRIVEELLSQMRSGRREPNTL